MAFVYDASIVDSIPSLEDAHSSIASNPLFKQFLSEFRDVATHYKHNDKYGLTLVHRHTTIGPQQRLMDFGRTLQTIHLDQKAQALHGYPISPKSLALRDASWKPYEYELGNYELPDPAFLTKAKELVERFSLTGVGLRRYSPDDPEELEITESGGISVKIPWKSSVDDQGTYTTTFWAFPLGEPRMYRCACVNTGSSTLPNHNHIDQP